MMISVRECPACGNSKPNTIVSNFFSREVRDLEHYVDVTETYWYCKKCKTGERIVSEVAPKRCRFTWRVIHQFFLWYDPYYRGLKKCAIMFGEEYGIEVGVHLLHTWLTKYSSVKDSLVRKMAMNPFI